MCCGLFDDYPDPTFYGGDSPKLDTDHKQQQWRIISVYTRRAASVLGDAKDERPPADAIRDGVLVPYRFMYQGQRYEACFTCALYERYKAYPAALKWIAQRAMRLLAYPDPQDTAHRKLRVILDNQIWAIEDADGLTLLRPEDQ